MNALGGPFAAVTVLLGAAAAAKIVEPTFTVGALRAAGLPARPTAVRLGGLVELAIAIVAVTTGARGAALVVCGSYLAFAAFVALALARNLPIGTCGCFGRPDTPPTAMHVMIDLAAAAVAFAVAIAPTGSPVHPAGVEGAAWIAYLIYAGLATAALGLLLTSRARLVGIVGRR